MASRSATSRVEQWGLYELALRGPAGGNPFLDVRFGGIFRQGHREVAVEGFYDGGGLYKVRFSPDTQGDWTCTTTSNVKALGGRKARLTVARPRRGNHGPVKVWRGRAFAYADGTRYYPFGTTCYAWPHQDPAVVRQTLSTLKTAPFNKMRMCVFPKSYTFNKNEPPRYPYVHTGPMPDEPAKSKPGDWRWDFTQFDPDYFRHFEWCVGQLLKLGIEADIILFHPYDRWGFRQLDPPADERYLHYAVARLGAYRNVWWSLANEWDLMKSQTEEGFDRFGRLIQTIDPYRRLMGNHNCHRFYDPSRPWITHVSAQGDTEGVPGWLAAYGKPVIVDETRYEGNVENGWGNITGREMSHRFWEGAAAGGYVGHGETYYNEQHLLWWAKGGRLIGQSPARIAFLRKIMQDGPAEFLEPVLQRGNRGLYLKNKYYLFYFGDGQPSWRDLELEGGPYRCEVIDTWKMTIKPVKGSFQGKCRLDLATRPCMAARFTAVAGGHGAQAR